MERTLAVIMGGGAGTRLFPLTKDRAKPTVPLGGKTAIRTATTKSVMQLALSTTNSCSGTGCHIADTAVANGNLINFKE